MPRVAVEARTPMRVRASVERWGVVHRLLRQVDALVQLNAYLDAGVRRRRRAGVVAEVEALAGVVARKVARESTRLTVEAAIAYHRSSR